MAITTSRVSESKQKICSDCKRPFLCGPGTGTSGCWCADFPPIMPAEFDQDCRCPSCLATAIVSRVQDGIESNGVQKMVQMARPYFNANVVREYIDYTMEGNKVVFTSWYHLKRGYCCGSGCRNCPYCQEG